MAISIYFVELEISGQFGVFMKLRKVPSRINLSIVEQFGM
jgi:hypothetical protein